jgi:hypothetical protein
MVLCTRYEIYTTFSSFLGVRAVSVMDTHRAVDIRLHMSWWSWFTFGILAFINLRRARAALMFQFVSKDVLGTVYRVKVAL